MTKTTVMLREDVHEALKKKYGARGMSKAINEILAEALLKGESMFGTMKNLTQRPERPQEQKMRYVVDSFAWPEYFMGTPTGMAAKNAADSTAADRTTILALRTTGRLLVLA